MAPLALLLIGFACDDGIVSRAGNSEPAPDSTVVEATATPTVTVSTISLDFDSWVKVNDGEWDQVTDGIRVFGAGHREGHQGL
jgi:hypothetical protein